jgi:hypothetical protein
MTILNATDRSGQSLSKQQIEEDMEQLLAAHEAALTSEPTWTFFGGVLTVNGHEYQVC